MRSLHSCITICVLATVHISCHAGWSDILVLLYCKVCVKFLHFFLKIHLGTHHVSLVQYIYETVIVPDIQTHPKHVYRVMWVNIVLL